jgi:hypothetical protein
VQVINAVHQMPTRIADYYTELQRREGLEPVQLVAEWAEADMDAISAAFRNAFAASGINPEDNSDSTPQY